MEQEEGHYVGGHGGRLERPPHVGEAGEADSINVDAPQHYSLSHHGLYGNRDQRRYSGFSESSVSESRFTDSTGPPTGKGHVSWSSEVTEYPPDN